MLRKFITVILVLISFLLQCTLFKSWSFASVSPNLLLIITFMAGFMSGKRNGMFTGFIAGMLIDLSYGNVIGFNTLLLVYIGYVNGMFNKMFYDEEITLPLALLVGSEFSFSFIYYVFTFLLRGRISFGYYFIHLILPEMAYTVVVAVLLYRLFLRLNRRLNEFEKRSAKKFG